MNINKIDARYITLKRERSFYARITIEKDNPLFLEIKENTDFDWNKMKEWLEKRFGLDENTHHPNYLMNSYSSYGSKETICQITLLRYVPNGFDYEIQYKGVKFSFDVMPNGEISKALVIYNFFGTLEQGYKDIGTHHETLDDLYASAISEIKKNKRKLMTHFNKLIKDTKAEYRNRLKQVNAILDWSDK